MKTFTLGSPSPVGSCIVYDDKGKPFANAETVANGTLIAQLLNDHFARNLKAMRRNLQDKLDAINPSNFYHESLPLVAIVEALDATGFNSKDFAGQWISGDQGSVNVSIGNGLFLCFSWYRMESGRWEVVMYIN